MAELNPYRQTARLLAFACYILAGMVLLAGVFFTLAAATTDPAEVGLKGAKSSLVALVAAGEFSAIAFLIVLFGRRVQALFGEPRLPVKLAARSAVGCLQLGGIGCGVWALLSAGITLVIGKTFITGEPAGVREIFVGMSSSVLAIILMLSIARFISVNYVRLKPYDAYLQRVKPLLPRFGEPEVRAFVQEETLAVLGKLDLPLKRALLIFLSEANLLAGPAAIVLAGADFRGADLRSSSLPEADLREINLEQASLQFAGLYRADLSQARLRKADLTRANLQEARLRSADLTEAVLEGAHLGGADLTGAQVTPQQLGKAYLEKTILPDGTMSGESP